MTDVAVRLEIRGFRVRATAISAHGRAVVRSIAEALAPFVLDAGATVRLYTGCGEPSDSSLYWCMQGSAVWNNDGDTVFLLDANGNIVVSRQYSA